MSLEEAIRAVGYKGVFAISKNNKIIKQSAYGYADVKNKKLNELNTIFRIASVTKQFTALAILKLYEESKLNLTDTLDQYMHGFRKGDTITIHHLLSNSSGIPNFSLDLDFDALIDEDNFIESLINLFKSDPEMFEPGEKFFYSISGYIVLQYIIEKVSHLNYETYLANHFFKPLGMTSTGLETPYKKVENMAIPYKTESEYARPFDMRIAGGGGGLYSNLHDLSKWLNALFNKNILKKETHDLMLQKHIKADEFNSYCYGMILSETDNYQRYYHPGGGFGVNSFIAFFPQSNYQYIMISNYEDRESFNQTKKLIEDYIKAN